MANFTTAAPTLDAGLAATATYGSFQRMYTARITASTINATLATGGSQFGAKYPIRPLIPSVGSGVAGYIPTGVAVMQTGSGYGLIAGIDYQLGTLNVGTGVFTAGVSMPTKTIRGEAIQTAASLIFVTIGTSISGTTPTLTTTYTNQDGTSSRTFTMVFPTSASSMSTFCVQSRLTGGDTGIRSISNMSISGSSSGEISIYGVLPFYYGYHNSSIEYRMGQFHAPMPSYLIEAGEYLGFYRLGGNQAGEMFASINFTPEAT